MKNKTNLILIEVAKHIPKSSRVVYYPSSIIGSDLILSGTNTVEGCLVDPKRDYVMKAPVYYEINHYKRMKKAFKKNGRDGIVRYLAPFFNQKGIDFIKTQLA